MILLGWIVNIIFIIVCIALIHDLIEAGIEDDKDGTRRSI